MENNLELNSKIKQISGQLSALSVIINFDKKRSLDITEQRDYLHCVNHIALNIEDLAMEMLSEIQDELATVEAKFGELE